MLACDAGWAASIPEREAQWLGDDDPVYGKGGTCWSGTDEDDAVCDQACEREFRSYREVLDSQIMEGELTGLPNGCDESDELD